MTQYIIDQKKVMSLLNDKVAFLIPVSALTLVLVLVLALLAIFVVSLMSGSYPLTVLEVWQAITMPLDVPNAEMVVWSFRFPRTLVAMMVGCLLALSGATLQSVTRNPLADPSLVGVSQGASLAVVSLIILFPNVSTYYRPIAAFLGAIAVAILIQWLSIKRQEASTMKFILIGIGVAALISAITNAMLTYGRLNDAMSALMWLSGSIHTVGWDEVRYLAIATILLLPILFLVSRPIAALQLGDDLSINLGVNIKLTKVILITLSVTLAAIATASVGPLGFIGLIAPHVARRIIYSGVLLHLLITGLVGALLVSTADLLGRTAVADAQIPAGILTAIIGVPIFVSVILRGRQTTDL